MISATIASGPSAWTLSAPMLYMSEVLQTDITYRQSPLLFYGLFDFLPLLLAS